MTLVIQDILFWGAMISIETESTHTTQDNSTAKIGKVYEGELKHWKRKTAAVEKGKQK